MLFSPKIYLEAVNFLFEGTQFTDTRTLGLHICFSISGLQNRLFNLFSAITQCYILNLRLKMLYLVKLLKHTVY